MYFVCALAKSLVEIPLSLMQISNKYNTQVTKQFELPYKHLKNVVAIVY